MKYDYLKKFCNKEYQPKDFTKLSLELTRSLIKTAKQEHPKAYTRLFEDYNYTLRNKIKEFLWSLNKVHAVDSNTPIRSHFHYSLTSHKYGYPYRGDTCSFELIKQPNDIYTIKFLYYYR